jgi:acid phosphatase family membrane protein YuiD
MLGELVSNRILITLLIAWLMAGILKIPIEYLETHNWNWGLLFSSGGMPSQHSSLVTANMLAVGLHTGFNTAAFAISFTLMMVVLYDAAGIRRQAGLQAQKINAMISEFFAGHPISEDQLKEVLGHTPREVIAGAGLGLVTSVVVWLFWH